MAVSPLCRRALALRNGRRNVAHIVWLTYEGAEAAFWSWLERYSDGVFRRGGLPLPERNVRLTPGVVDCVWRAAHLVVELDGLRFHLLTDQRRRDRAKGNALTLAGYRVLRFTYLDVVEAPDRVIREISAALY